MTPGHSIEHSGLCGAGKVVLYGVWKVKGKAYEPTRSMQHAPACLLLKENSHTVREEKRAAEGFEGL